MPLRAIGHRQLAGWKPRGLIEYVEQLGLQVAPDFIRVNAVHPTNVNTHLLHNDGLYSLFRPDIEQPTREDVLPAFTHFQAMPIPYVEPVDISNLVLFLASGGGSGLFSAKSIASCTCALISSSSL